MVKERAKVVMPIITVGSVDDVHTFYTDKPGFTRVMGAVGEDGFLDNQALGRPRPPRPTQLIRPGRDFW